MKVFMWIFAILTALWTANVNACSDLNGNGDVDIADFLIFVDDYGKSVTRSDFNDDDIVDITDFLIFVDDYGKSVTCNEQDSGSVEGDRQALIDLYNATGKWKRRRNWLSDKPLNEWYGVTTTVEGRVDSLLLSRNNLSGSIPESLCNLSHLEFLDLTGDLWGTIPQCLGNLTRLKVLHFGGGQMGPIPSSIGNLVNLQELNTGGEGPIPPELGNLVNLTWLSLGSTTGTIPPSLGNLVKLETLWLAGNQLTGSIPPELGNLVNLTQLSFESNLLTGPIPESFINLTNLQTLWVGRNPGLCLPSSIYDWASFLDRSDAWKLPDCD